MTPASPGAGEAPPEAIFVTCNSEVLIKLFDVLFEANVWYEREWQLLMVGCKQ